MSQHLLFPVSGKSPQKSPEAGWQRAASPLLEQEPSRGRKVTKVSSQEPFSQSGWVRNEMFENPCTSENMEPSQDEPRGSPGQIVILNGAPRSGKSSIAREIQETFEGVWMNLGVDGFKQMTPRRYQPGIGLRPGG